MSTKIRVRRVSKAADFAAIRRLDKKFFALDEPVDIPGDTFWWVAEVLQSKNRTKKWTLAGYAGLRPCRQEPNIGLGFLIRAGVCKESRGHGLQKALIRVRVAAAKRLGLKSLVTYIVPWNPASGNALIRCGFRMYRPAHRWGGSMAVYLKRDLG